MGTGTASHMNQKPMCIVTDLLDTSPRTHHDTHSFRDTDVQARASLHTGTCLYIGKHTLARTHMLEWHACRHAVICVRACPVLPPSLQFTVRRAAAALTHCRWPFVRWYRRRPDAMCIGGLTSRWLCVSTCPNLFMWRAL